VNLTSILLEIKDRNRLGNPCQHCVVSTIELFRDVLLMKLFQVVNSDQQIKLWLFLPSPKWNHHKLTLSERCLW
jgi:hypothetical protein